MLVKFDQNHMVLTVQNFDLFDKRDYTILEDVSVTETIA